MATSIPSRSKLAAETCIAPTCAAGVLAVSLYLGLHPHLHGPLCLMRTVIGLPCPGCGMTRSLSSLWRGHLWLSFRYHPLGIPLFLVCIVCILMFACDQFFPQIRPATARFRRRVLDVKVMCSIAVLSVALWITRLILLHAGNPLFLW